MNIQNLIDDYAQWLKSEIKFEKIGEYYEISTPFLDSGNDYIQFYVRLDGDNIEFTDDGFTLNQLEMSGFQLNAGRKKMISNLLRPYGSEMYGNEIVSKADVKSFAQRKHMYMQSIMKIDDLFMLTRSRSNSNFSEEVQTFFDAKDIYYTDNVQFIGTSGFSHNYEFVMQRSKNKPERLCRVMNNPNRSNMGNILFAWNDTRPARRQDSKLIVLLNDSNTIGKGVEEAFYNYDANVIKWSEKDFPANIEMLTA